MGERIEVELQLPSLLGIGHRYIGNHPLNIALEIRVPSAVLGGESFAASMVQIRAQAPGGFTGNSDSVVPHPSGDRLGHLPPLDASLRFVDFKSFVLGDVPHASHKI